MADQDTSLLLAATGLLILGAAHFVGTKIRRTRRWKTRPIYTTRWKNGLFDTSLESGSVSMVTSE
jgi:hypothetical protein